MDEKGIKENAAKLLERIRADKKLELCIYAGLALLCIGFIAFPSVDKSQEYTAKEVKYNDDDLEQRLTDILGLVRGTGKVKVMITYETGAEIVPAMSTDVSESILGLNGEGGNRTESSEPVTVYRDGENEAIVLMERMPQVRGVIVVAEGAADVSVRMKLQSAVVAALGVEAGRVEVLEMGINGMED